MGKKLDEFKSEIKGKRVSVIGVGVSNIPAIKYLNKLGAYIIARDKNTEIPEELKSLDNIEFVFGENYLENLKESDYIFRSPGVKPFLKEIEDAVSSGVILTSEIETFIHLTDATVIGITGSDGKTTTTTLTYKFLSEAGKSVYVGGNIGTPLLDKVDLITKDDYVVLELSSFQLMTLKENIDRALVTNISPNHLDYHNNFEEYINSKANIFNGQNDFGLLVLNADDENSKIYEPQAKGRIRRFSIKTAVDCGVYLKDGAIMSTVGCRNRKIVEEKEVKLLGKHNIANACAAATLIIDICGEEAVRSVLRNFDRIEHRMEFVRELDGVKWYNDSMSSSPSRTIAGLNSFDKKIILIAGGYDKNIPYDVLGPYIMDKVKVLVLVGATSPKIKEAADNEAKNRNVDNVQTALFDNLKNAVEYCKKISVSGDIVAMSPASASFDLYKDFAVRGNYFKELVNELK